MKCKGLWQAEVLQLEKWQCHWPKRGTAVADREILWQLQQAMYRERWTPEIIENQYVMYEIDEWCLQKRALSNETVETLNISSRDSMLASIRRSTVSTSRMELSSGLTKCIKTSVRVLSTIPSSFEWSLNSSTLTISFVMFPTTLLDDSTLD